MAINIYEGDYKSDQVVKHVMDLNTMEDGKFYNKIAYIKAVDRREVILVDKNKREVRASLSREYSGSTEILRGKIVRGNMQYIHSMVDLQSLTIISNYKDYGIDMNMFKDSKEEEIMIIKGMVRSDETYLKAVNRMLISKGAYDDLASDNDKVDHVLNVLKVLSSIYKGTQEEYVEDALAFILCKAYEIKEKDREGLSGSLQRVKTTLVKDLTVLAVTSEHEDEEKLYNFMERVAHVSDCVLFIGNNRDVRSANLSRINLMVSSLI